MAENDRVTQRQFFESVGEIKDTLNGVNRELGELNTLIKADHERLATVCDDVEDLKKADRGVLAIATAVGGAIGTASAAFMKFVLGD